MGMRLPVLVQIALRLERETTRYAWIRPLAGMGPDVFLQNAWFRARPAAVRADVFAWLFGFVLFFVSIFGLFDTFLGVLAVSRVET